MRPVPSRRTVLRTLAVGGTAGLAGCGEVLASETPAHTVSVYLGDREATREVTVRIEAADDSVLFEREYSLSDDNEADEDATFPESTEPREVIVTVDGTRFERAWPGLDQPDAECSDGNWSGVEVWVEGGPDESPTVRLERNCQHVTLT
jgi:hypothetical protein